jgi:hypothetical protein
MMTCQQLGGACDKAFHASSFEEISGMSKQHAMEVFQKKDAAHLRATNEMEEHSPRPRLSARLGWPQAPRGAGARPEMVR